MTPFFQRVHIVAAVVVVHHVIAQDIDHHLEWNDHYCKQEIKQKVFLFDSPLRTQGSFLVEVPDKQSSKRLVIEGYQVEQTNGILTITKICLNVFV